MVVVFKDCFTKDELCSDSYKMSAPFGKPELMDVAFEVQTSWVTKGGEDYGIADNAEEDEGAPGGSAAEKVIDVISNFKLEECTFQKKEFLSYIKGHLIAVKDKMAVEKPDRVDAFMKGTQALMKEVATKFSDMQFFFGENYLDHFEDFKAVPVLCYYKDGEIAPNLIFIRDALIQEKF